MSVVAINIVSCNNPLSIKTNHCYQTGSLRPLTKGRNRSLFFSEQYETRQKQKSFGKLKSQPICYRDKTS